MLNTHFTMWFTEGDTIILSDQGMVNSKLNLIKFKDKEATGLYEWPILSTESGLALHFISKHYQALDGWKTTVLLKAPLITPGSHIRHERAGGKRLLTSVHRRTHKVLFPSLSQTKALPWLTHSPARTAGEDQRKVQTEPVNSNRHSLKQCVRLDHKTIMCRSNSCLKRAASMLLSKNRVAVSVS